MPVISDPWQLYRIEHRLINLGRQLDRIERREIRIIMSIEAITQEVTEATTVMESARALIEGLAAELRAAIGNPAALKALADKLDNETNNLANAVVANTPAQP